ncbi:hypothetical protein C0991_003154 [Blastosporella zonata]|nr:hypothetical protein C0991_003154 [Blastosporella zonata]
MFKSLWRSLLVGTLAFALQEANAASGTYEQVHDFGPNPTNVGMFLYRPPVVAVSPPLVVAIHYCTGTAQAFFSGTEYANLADRYGYIVIFPEAPDSGGCWDVHTDATLTHDGGGDSLGIASMIRHAIANYSVDSNRVFVTGLSSGAMMTNVLAGAYPDLFQAGAAYAGVPYGCYAGPDMWNSACATGNVNKLGQQWGDLVRNGYPGYQGPRPKMQLWHGTEDEIIDYNNFKEGIKQWTNVFDISPTRTTAQYNSPLPGWTRSIYSQKFETISAIGVPHDIKLQEIQVLEWFEIIATPEISAYDACAIPEVFISSSQVCPNFYLPSLF